MKNYVSSKLPRNSVETEQNGLKDHFQDKFFTILGNRQVPKVKFSKIYSKVNRKASNQLNWYTDKYFTAFLTPFNTLFDQVIYNGTVVHISYAIKDNANSDLNQDKNGYISETV